jgi:hypothetical protein
MNKKTKPPVGILPKETHDAIRKADLLDAMIRYLKSGNPVPAEWVKEFNDLKGGEIYES